ncbi:MAG: hypothetical protein QOF85_1796 [Solirubrobacterales bacterium]|jgi:hypothetical protein|nr:hypothetical protein [Solirubrobacterales bacterium]
MAPVVFLFVCGEAIVSILARWPHQFTGPGDPDKILSDFLRYGTLLSPPLPILLMFGVTIVLIGRDRSRGLGAAILSAICLVMSAGALGEALAPASPDVPYLLQVSSGILGAAAFAFLLVMSLAVSRECFLPKDP